MQWRSLGFTCSKSPLWRMRMGQTLHLTDDFKQRIWQIGPVKVEEWIVKDNLGDLWKNNTDNLSNS